MQDKWEVIKNVAALAAAGGEILLLITTRFGSYLIALRLLLALFLLLWGWFERKNPRPFYRSLAWIAIIFGSVVTVSSLTVLALLQTANPRLWAASAPVAYEKSFTLRKQGERYVGSYRPQFDRDADFAEVLILPAAADTGHVAELIISRIEIAPTARENVREVREGEDDVHLSVEVVAPTSNYDFVLHLEAGTRAAGLSPPEVKMLAQYKYVKHGAFWRKRQWLHDQYGK